MRLSIVTVTLAVVATTLATSHSGRSPLHGGKAARAQPFVSRDIPHQHSKRATKSRFLSPQTAKYIVNGTAIPDVDFDIGESYAGLMPIGSHSNASSSHEIDPSLYFWFFPSENPKASDEIVIWFNGGPGCSSLEGLLQENGPFIWQYGTFKPVPNPYTWVKLTNVVWVEYPLGTGFTQGVPTAQGAEDAAVQFLGFWKNFVDTFGLQNHRIFIAGESYAGIYIPYVAHEMLDKNDTKYYNLEGTLLYDPLISYYSTQSEIPIVPFVESWGRLFPFNDTYRSALHKQSKSCGYDAYLKKYLQFPPPGPFPERLPGTNPDLSYIDNCDLYAQVSSEISLLNPCFSPYQVATTCPVLWDVLGLPGAFDYTPDGASIYFNRTDVQKAINAPIGAWATCSDGVFINDTDISDPPALKVLPSVVERSKRTVIAHGALDMYLIANGTLLAIQNMTWNRVQGFTSAPKDLFVVPYHNQGPTATLAGAGIMGKTHTERGLTYVEVDLAGHMLPQFAPSAAYRHLEFLLGRVKSLSTNTPFTTDPNPHS